MFSQRSKSLIHLTVKVIITRFLCQGTLDGNVAGEQHKLSKNVLQNIEFLIPFIFRESITIILTNILLKEQNNECP